MEPIGQGSSGPEVRDIQRRLGELGHACVQEAGTFAGATVRAVRTFQQQRGLVADGVVGDETWRALVGASFRLGDRILYVTRPMLQGDDVRELQRRLNRLGFDAGYDDGLYGPQTHRAVAEFQLNVGIAVDGLAGPGTVDLLHRLHRQHQAASAAAVRERELLRRPPRVAMAGARVMVDPARSPADVGLRAPDGTPEHAVNWLLAAAVEGRLAALGAHVVLSRGPTTSPTPSQRAAYANAEDVELILSLQCNGNRSAAARGAAAYYFGTETQISDRGRQLAETALTSVVTRTGTVDCRAHPTVTAILRESRAPAAIVEPGFLTHPDEGAALSEVGYQQRVAAALTDAVVTFLVGRPSAAA